MVMLAGHSDPLGRPFPMAQLPQCYGGSVVAGRQPPVAEGNSNKLVYKLVKVNEDGTMCPATEEEVFQLEAMVGMLDETSSSSDVPEDGDIDSDNSDDDDEDDDDDDEDGDEDEDDEDEDGDDEDDDDDGDDDDDDEEGEADNGLRDDGSMDTMKEDYEADGRTQFSEVCGFSQTKAPRNGVPQQALDERSRPANNEGYGQSNDGRRNLLARMEVLNSYLLKVEEQGRVQASAPQADVRCMTVGLQGYGDAVSESKRRRRPNPKYFSCGDKGDFVAIQSPALNNNHRASQGEHAPFHPGALRGRKRRSGSRRRLPGKKRKGAVLLANRDPLGRFLRKDEVLKNTQTVDRRTHLGQSTAKLEEQPAECLFSSAPVASSITSISCIPAAKSMPMYTASDASVLSRGLALSVTDKDQGCGKGTKRNCSSPSSSTQKGFQSTVRQGDLSPSIGGYGPVVDEDPTVVLRGRGRTQPAAEPRLQGEWILNSVRMAADQSRVAAGLVTVSQRNCVERGVQCDQDLEHASKLNSIYMEGRNSEMSCNSQNALSPLCLSGITGQYILAGTGSMDAVEDVQGRKEGLAAPVTTLCTLPISSSGNLNCPKNVMSTMPSRKKKLTVILPSAPVDYRSARIPAAVLDANQTGQDFDMAPSSQGNQPPVSPRSAVPLAAKGGGGATFFSGVSSSQPLIVGIAACTGSNDAHRRGGMAAPVSCLDACESGAGHPGVGGIKETDSSSPARSEVPEQGIIRSGQSGGGAVESLICNEGTLAAELGNQGGGGSSTSGGNPNKRQRKPNPRYFNEHRAAEINPTSSTNAVLLSVPQSVPLGNGTLKSGLVGHQPLLEAHQVGMRVVNAASGSKGAGVGERQSGRPDLEFASAGGSGGSIPTTRGKRKQISPMDCRVLKIAKFGSGIGHHDKLSIISHVQVNAPPAPMEREGDGSHVQQPLSTECYSHDLNVIRDLASIECNPESGTNPSPAVVPTTNGVTRRKHHRPWTLKEVMTLIEGVARCGGGKWADIKKLAFSSVGHRTAVDLKDKWRNLLRASRLPPQSGSQAFNTENSFIILPPHLNLNNLSCGVEELTNIHNDQGEIRKKHSAALIPASVLARVRELAALHSQKANASVTSGACGTPTPAQKR